MNHPSKCQLLIYLDENPANLSDVDLADYRWLVEQLLQELRERTLERRIETAHDTPLRP